MLASSTSSTKRKQEDVMVALQLETRHNMSMLKSQFNVLLTSLRQSTLQNSSQTRNSIALLSERTLALEGDMTHVRANQSMVLVGHAQRLEQIESGMALKASDLDLLTTRTIVNEIKLNLTKMNSLLIFGHASPSNAVQLLNQTLQQHLSASESRLDAHGSMLDQVSSSLSLVSSRLTSVATDVQNRAVKTEMDQTISGLSAAVTTLREYLFFLSLSFFFSVLLWRFNLSDSVLLCLSLAYIRTCSWFSL
jgi:hypothetical protein